MLALFVWNQSDDDTRSFCRRLQLERTAVDVLQRIRPLVKTLQSRWLRIDSPSDRLLAASELGPSGRALARATCGEEIRSFLMADWEQIRQGDLQISGDDLIRHGHASGPSIGAALARTRRARLDGEITRAQELSFAIRYLERMVTRPSEGDPGGGAPPPCGGKREGG